MSVQTAIVTGAARGIGAATASLLAKNGVRVLIADLDESGAKAMASSLSSERVGVTAIACDVTNESEVERLATYADKQLGRVDCLVNNAGIIWKAGPSTIDAMTTEEWNTVINVDLTGYFLCARAVLPSMKARRFGRIINVASMAIRTGGRGGFPHYVAAKAGVVGLTKALANEGGAFNITANAVAPGLIETEMSAKQNDQARRDMLKRIPLGRYGRPEDVADVILCMASDHFSYVNGVTLDINGGIVMI